MFHIENKTGITEDQLNKIPAIFANEKAEKCSDSYQHLPTIEVIKSLANKGWRPTWIGQCKTRKIDQLDKTKHMIKFKNFEKDLKVGDSEIELLLKNSHNTQSSLQFMTGLFRFICANELVTCDSVFPTIRIRHQNVTIQDALGASEKIIENVDSTKDVIQAMQKIKLDQSQKIEFSRDALALRYPKAEFRPITAADINRPRRQADNESDLWTVFNRIQENLIKGGIGYISLERQLDGTMRHVHRRTRAVKSIDANLKLNQKLFELTNQYV